MSISFRFLSLLFLAFLTTNGNVNTKETSRHLAGYIHQSFGHSIKRSILQTKQQNCETILENYPMECNITLLVGNVTNVVDNAPDTLSPRDYATLNDAYSKICVTKCIDPIIQYYECFLSGDILTYFKNLVQQGICGKHGDDFCEVLYLRRYASNIRFFDQLVDTCPFISSGIDCSSANNTCQALVSNFNTNMGCCTLPYLGSDVSSCGINVANPCQSAIPSVSPPTVPGPSGTVATPTPSSYNIIAPAIFSVLIAVFSTYFI